LTVQVLDTVLPGKMATTMKMKKALFGILTLTMALAAKVHAQSFLADGLVAYYPFNGNANDASGNGHNGTINNASLTTDRFGNPSSALVFNGTNSSVPISLQQIDVTNYTISGWFKTSSGGPIVSGIGASHQVGLSLWMWTAVNSPLLTGQLGFVADGVFTQIGAQSQSTYLDNTWHQVVGVFSGSVGPVTTSQFTLYVDGSNVGQSNAVVGAASAPINNGANLTIGSRTYSPPETLETFDGVLDDIRIYNRVLSDSEVQQLYAYESTPPPGFQTNGLVAYYPFNGNANDASGNGNNGSLINNDWTYSFDRFGNPQSSLFLNTTSILGGAGVWTYVSAPKSSALDFNQDFTLSVWVSLSTISRPSFAQNLISNGPDSQSANLRIETDASSYGGQDYLQFCCGSGQNIFVLSSPVRQTWWQFSAVRSGGVLTLFRNGSLLTNGVITTMVNNPMLWFGNHENSAQYPLVGGIDDVRIYNRALSTKEIQQLYAYESRPVVTLRKAVSPSFSNLYLGTNYQLQVSTDLSTWTNSGSAFTPTNGVMDYPQYFDVDDWGQLFFRLETTR